MQPLVGAIEAWLAILNNLPFPIYAFVNLSLFLFLIPTIVKLILSFRG